MSAPTWQNLTEPILFPAKPPTFVLFVVVAEIVIEPSLTLHSLIAPTPLLNPTNSPTFPWLSLVPAVTVAVIDELFIIEQLYMFLAFVPTNTPIPLSFAIEPSCVIITLLAVKFFIVPVFSANIPPLSFVVLNVRFEIVFPLPSNVGQTGFSY